MWNPLIMNIHQILGGKNWISIAVFLSLLIIATLPLQLLATVIAHYYCLLSISPDILKEFKDYCTRLNLTWHFEGIQGNIAQGPRVNLRFPGNTRQQCTRTKDQSSCDILWKGIFFIVILFPVTLWNLISFYCQDKT